MKETTRYAYEKRIRILEAKNKQLESDYYTYRTCIHEIYEGIKDVSRSSLTINTSWLLVQIKRCLK